MCGVYCIENLINYKRYIGQSVNIERRWSQHKSLLNNQKHENQHLQRAWNEYGPDAFRFYILAECNVEDLDNIETSYISFYDSTNEENGYNYESGGHLNKSISEATKQKISQANSGHKHTDETKRKMSKSRMGHSISKENIQKMIEGHIRAGFTQDGLRRLSEANQGKVLSEETKIKISEVLKGIKRSEETKQKISENHANKHPAYCPQLDEYFNTILEVEFKYGIARQNIIKCINGKRKSAGKHPVTGEKLIWVDMKE